MLQNKGNLIDWIFFPLVAIADVIALYIYREREGEWERDLLRR